MNARNCKTTIPGAKNCHEWHKLSIKKLAEEKVMMKCQKETVKLLSSRNLWQERDREILHAIDSAENFEEFDKSPHTHLCSIWITVAQQSMHKRCQIARLV
jgi:hypothetical protein